MRFVNLERLGLRWSTVGLLLLTLTLYFFFNLRGISRIVYKRAKAVPPRMTHGSMMDIDPNVTPKNDKIFNFFRSMSTGTRPTQPCICCLMSMREGSIDQIGRISSRKLELCSRETLPSADLKKSSKNKKIPESAESRLRELGTDKCLFWWVFFGKGGECLFDLGYLLLIIIFCILDI